jgi:uncharacterized protein with FMN-binding domain
VACAIVLSVPSVNAWAAAFHKTSRKKVAAVVKVVKGPTVKCSLTADKWGPLQIDLKISKVPGSAKFKILAVTWPIWPTHTVRSKFINEKALPLLQQEVLQLQAASATKIETISGATNVSDSFLKSLQAALLAAAKA